MTFLNLLHRGASLLKLVTLAFFAATVASAIVAVPVWVASHTLRRTPETALSPKPALATAGMGGAATLPPKPALASTDVARAAAPPPKPRLPSTGAGHTPAPMANAVPIDRHTPVTDVPTASAGHTPAPTANAVPIAPHTPVMDVPTASAGQTRLRIGDRMSLSFYEHLAVDDEQKWVYRTRGRRPPQDYYERTELAGQYEVQQDGTITVPLLGALQVAGRTLYEFESDAAVVFDRRIGPLAFINTTIEHQPVYVLGPVKNPGTYKYTPDLTVLHLVAMSGGFDRATMDLGRMLETMRSFDKKQKSANELKRSWARLAVLTSERDRTKVVLPEQLIAVAGQADAKALVEAESAARELFLAGRRNQTSALATAEASAKSELEHLKVRKHEIESNIALRSERTAAFDKLGDRIARPLVAQASAEISQVKEHLAEAKVSIEQTENKIDQLASERSKLENEVRAGVESEIISLRAQIADAQSSLSADAGALEIVRRAAADSQAGSDGNTQFEIVRLTSQGHQVLKASGTDVVLPGDLVRVKLVTDLRIAEIR
jgi:protein involved in polysaccharide export with SLBB domain